MPRTADAIVAELHDVLQASGTGAPYVLAAHSFGGLFARLYAATCPDEVVGMVLIDGWQEDLPAILGPAQWAAFVDLATPPPPGLEAYRDLESVDFAAASARMAEAARTEPLKPLPLFVISRAKPVRLPPNVPSTFSARNARTWARRRPARPATASGADRPGAEVILFVRLTNGSSAKQTAIVGRDPVSHTERRTRSPRTMARRRSAAARPRDRPLSVVGKAARPAKNGERHLHVLQGEIHIRWPRCSARRALRFIEALQTESRPASARQASPHRRASDGPMNGARRRTQRRSQTA